MLARKLTYVRVKARWCYLYRAIDSTGATIDFLLSALRDTAAAKRPFAGALSDPSHPQRHVQMTLRRVWGGGASIGKPPSWPPINSRAASVRPPKPLRSDGVGITTGSRKTGTTNGPSTWPNN